jgi:pimeloyl-ACP methyl ester carboxylesterase
MRDEVLLLGAGGKLAFTDIGEPGWPCVLLFHGAPASRLRVAYLEEAFLAARVRVVSPDRPGYGRSSSRVGRSLTDWPADVEAIADSLGLRRCVVAGHSSGGPYAVACAAMLGSRVSACVTLGGVTDMGWPDAWDDYPAVEAALMRLQDEAAILAACVEHFGEHGEQFLAASGWEMPEPDRRLYEDERVAAMLSEARAEAFRQGVGGYAQDLAVQARPWPFRPHAIAAPTVVVHGEQDSLLPLAHSRHTAEIVPGSKLDVLPGHGHFTVLGELPRLVTELSGAAG